VTSGEAVRFGLARAGARCEAPAGWRAAGKIATDSGAKLVNAREPLVSFDPPGLRSATAPAVRIERMHAVQTTRTSAPA
jgi:hypothetical protein